MSERSRATRTLLRWLPALGLMTLIFVLSSQSGLKISEDAGVDRPLRTLAHFTAYALLAAALLFAISGSNSVSARAALVALIVAVLYGLSDEIHQAFVPDRTGQLKDLVVDGLGAGVGVLIAFVLLRQR